MMTKDQAKELEQKVSKFVTAFAIMVTAATIERVLIKFLKKYLLEK